MPGHRNHRERYETHSYAGFLLRLGAVLVFLAACLSPAAALAQSESDEVGDRLVLSGCDADQFPSVTLRLGAWDARGNFLPGLDPSNLAVVEGGTRIRPDRVEVTEVGLQFTLAVNISPVLSGQEQGATQYEHLRQSLLRWARAQQGQEDDFSFSTPAGLYLIHSKQPSEWAQALQDYQPDLTKLQPSLNSLAEALNLAAEPGAGDPVRRAILYITPALPATLEANLPELTGRAADLGVKVFVWLVAPPTNAPLSEDHPLVLMAAETGGTFQQVYFPDRALDPATLLDPLKKMYLVHYQSALRETGDHAVRVQRSQAGETLLSNDQMIEVSVRPPNPIFLSPPAEVQRSWSVPAADQPARLAPQEVSLQILVEFPDGHARPLRATRLFMDGEMVAENDAPPFDTFLWQVSGVEQTGQHLLRVEVVDALGITGASTELPVQVIVPAPLEQKLNNRLFGALSGRSLVVLAAVGVSGMALVFALAFNDRKGKGALALAKARRGGKTQRRSGTSVVSRPVMARAPAGGIEQNGILEAAAAPARLVSLNENEQPVVGATIPITGQEITIGSDPHRATRLLESPTVDGLHARVFRNGSGTFFLADGNSVAGTWINYAPTSAHGARLEHGDLVHIGRVMFRFELTDPAQAQLAQVSVIGPHDSTPLDAGSSK